jgi:hypothetical protein
VRGRLTALVVFAVAALTAVPAARAHGPAPAVIAPLGADAAGALGVVQLSVGAGVRGIDGRWYFACPALWGAPEAPLMAPGAGALWVAADRGILGIDVASGAAVETDVPVESASTVAMRALGDNVFVLAFAGGDAALWRLGAASGGERTLEDDVRWSTLAVGPDLVLLGRAIDGELVVRTLSAAGEGRDEAAYDFEGLVAPSLRVTDGQAFVTGAEIDMTTLFAIEDVGLRPLAAGEGAIHGPARLASGALIGIVEGAIVRLEAATGDAAGAPGEVLDDARRYTCLAEVGAAVYACAQETLWRLGPDGRPESLAFEITELVAELAPPASAGADARAQCGAEWADFAGHAGIPRRRPDLGDAPADTGAEDADRADLGDASAASDAGAGCVVATLGSEGRTNIGAWLLGAALALSLRCRRGRPRARRLRPRSRNPHRPAT